jgi:hypothetical protein
MAILAGATHIVFLGHAADLFEAPQRFVPHLRARAER